MAVFRDNIHWGLVSIVLKLAACCCGDSPRKKENYLSTEYMGCAEGFLLLQHVLFLVLQEISLWAEMLLFTALMVPAETSAKPLTPNVSHLTHSSPQPFPHFVCDPVGSPVVKTYVYSVALPSVLCCCDMCCS